MLLFINELRHIRVVRQADAGGVREPLGRFRKHETIVPEDLVAELSGDELAEVEAAIARLALGEKSQLRSEIARLPEMLSAIADFYRYEADELEQRWIRGAVQEAMRLVRGHDRTSTPSGNP
jgi:hypothetical protein